MVIIIFPAFFHVFGFYSVFLFNFRGVGSVGNYSPQQIGQILASMLLELESPSNDLRFDPLGNYKLNCIIGLVFENGS